MKASVAFASAWLVAGAGCASLECQPATLVVADKEERSRVETGSGGLYRTTGTGRLEPMVAPTIVREYWVRATDEKWYRVTAQQYESAETGGSIQICR